MVNRRKRLVAAALLGISLALSLSACNRNYEILGPYSLGYNGEDLLIGLCANMEIDRVRLTATPQGSRTRNDTLTVWQASGDLSVREGDAVIVGGSNPGLASEIVADDVRPLPGMLLVLGFNDMSEATLSAVFEIPDDGLAPGTWLTPLGEIRDSPCE